MGLLSAGVSEHQNPGRRLVISVELRQKTMDDVAVEPPASTCPLGIDADAVQIELDTLIEVHHDDLVIGDSHSHSSDSSKQLPCEVEAEPDEKYAAN